MTPFAALSRLALHERDWQHPVLGIESRYWRAVGTVDALLAKARDIGQCWLKGVGRFVDGLPRARRCTTELTKV